MKIVDKFLEKHGADPVIHFGYGAWLTQIGSMFGLFGTFVAFVVMMLLVLVKEFFFDAKVSRTDIAYSLYGGIVAIVVFLCFFAFL